jgi:hypothetical protein
MPEHLRAALTALELAIADRRRLDISNMIMDGASDDSIEGFLEAHVESIAEGRPQLIAFFDAVGTQLRDADAFIVYLENERHVRIEITTRERAA